MTNSKAYKALTNARSVLLIDNPFFGCLVLQLKPVEADWQETMATDGTHLYYNTNFVLNEVNEIQLVGVIAHEAYHCARKHHVRMGDRELDRWNIACDHIVNLDLLDQGFQLPDWVLKDIAYRGMSPEEVYNLLPKDNGKGKSQQGQQGSQGQQGPQGNGGNQTPSNGAGKPSQGGNGQAQGPQGQRASDPGKMGGVMMPAPAWDTEAIGAEAAKWDSIARMAVGVAKAQYAGKLPGYIERLISELNKPRIAWESILRNFVDESVHKAYTWSRPNKRYLHAGFIFPSLVPDRISHIVSVMDTSGSVTPKMLNKYAAEKSALLDEGLADKLTVIYTDTKVQKVEVFERGDEVKLSPKGGGGTDFRAAMKYIAENCEDASVILFFTDLEVRNFGDDPDIPTLWIVYNNSTRYKQLVGKIPYGEAINALDV